MPSDLRLSKGWGRRVATAHRSKTGSIANSIFMAGRACSLTTPATESPAEGRPPANAAEDSTNLGLGPPPAAYRSNPPLPKLLHQHTPGLQQSLSSGSAREALAREYLHVVDPGRVQAADMLHPLFRAFTAGH